MMLTLFTLQRALPYILCGGVAFSSAWWIQSNSIDSLKNEHQSYVNQQEELVRLANKAAFKLKEQADHDYQVADQKLQQEIERGDTFRRCVAAGKCGALVIRVPTNPGQTGTVTSSCSNDGTGPNSIPVGSNTTETQIQTPPIVEECAVTTLRLNQLQSFIESQTDY